MLEQMWGNEKSIHHWWGATWANRSGNQDVEFSKTKNKSPDD